MWCRRCSQDVPAIAAMDGSADVVCGRCGTSLKTGSDPVLTSTAKPHFASTETRSTVGVAPLESALDAVSTAKSTTTETPVSLRTTTLLGLDDWDLQTDLDRADTLLRQHGSLTSLGDLTQQHRVDAPHGSDGPRKSVLATNDATSSSDDEHLHAQTIASTPLTWPVWLLICGGMMSLVFGMILCGWSLGTSREDLWRIGLPALLGGQAIVLLGFVFQLDSLWRNYRQANEAIRGLGARLAEVQRGVVDERPSLLATARGEQSRL